MSDAKISDLLKAIFGTDVSESTTSLESGSASSSSADNVRSISVNEQNPQQRICQDPMSPSLLLNDGLDEALLEQLASQYDNDNKLSGTPPSPSPTNSAPNSQNNSNTRLTNTLADVRLRDEFEFDDPDMDAALSQIVIPCIVQPTAVPMESAQKHVPRNQSGPILISNPSTLPQPTLQPAALDRGPVRQRTSTSVKASTAPLNQNRPLNTSTIPDSYHSNKPQVIVRPAYNTTVSGVRTRYQSTTTAAVANRTTVIGNQKWQPKPPPTQITSSLSALNKLNRKRM